MSKKETGDTKSDGVFLEHVAYWDLLWSVFIERMLPFGSSMIYQNNLSQGSAIDDELEIVGCFQLALALFRYICCLTYGLTFLVYPQLTPQKDATWPYHS